MKQDSRVNLMADTAFAHAEDLRFAPPIAPGVAFDPTDASVSAGRETSALRVWRRINIALALSDGLSLWIGLFLAQNFFGDASSTGVRAILNAAPLAWIAVHFLWGLYSAQHLSPTEEFRRALSASGVGMVVVILAGYLSDTHIPRDLLGASLGTALVLELASRRFWRAIIAYLKATGSLALRTVIVGTNREAVEISEQLRSRGSGFFPVGHVAVSSTSVQPPSLPVVGGIASLAEKLRSEKIDCVFVASTEVKRVEMPQVLQAARQAGVDVRVSANLPELLTHRVVVQSVGKCMALTVKPAQLSGTQALVKRAFDLAFAMSMLVVTAPLFLIAALAVRFSSPGPIFFKQTRVTQGGREFNMVKFRTMRDDLDLDELGFDPTVPFFKPDDDPRITRIGAVLRKLSIDELPQFLNVLRGDMAVVGPRPLPAEQVNANSAMLSARLEVPAGVTGWWQIRGRSNADSSVAVGLDTFYIENWSVALDLYIVLKTFGAVLQRVGAR